ncbi:MAG: hypothetical protein RBS38_07165 [Bacteroidales bacterium]|nr:hypothetical protein [Bacteroidales bacterium]
MYLNQRTKRFIKELVRLKCKTQNKMPVELIREMQYELDQWKQKDKK